MKDKYNVVTLTRSSHIWHIVCVILREDIISPHAISRRNYFRTAGGWFLAPFVLKIVRFTFI